MSADDNDGDLIWSEAGQTYVPNDNDNDNDNIIRAKWTIDGAETLEEAAIKAGGFAACLRELAAGGWELTGPVEDDYGFIRKTP